MNMYFAHFGRPLLRVVRSALAVIALGVGASSTGCTSDDPSAVPSSGVDAGAPRRQLLQDDGIGTDPNNLIVDPSFTSPNKSLYLFLAMTKSEIAPIDVVADSQSPTGAGGRIAVLVAPDASDTKSESIMLMSSFNGGQGPFEALVWVSKTDLHGKPAQDVPTGDGGIRASITTSPGAVSSKAYDLAPTGDPLVTANGRTWISLRARIEEPLERTGFLVVETGTDGGKYLVASPSVIAEPLAKGVPTRGLSLMRALPRALTAREHDALRRYERQKPQLTRPAIKLPSWLHGASITAR